MRTLALIVVILSLAGCGFNDGMPAPVVSTQWAKHFGVNIEVNYVEPRALEYDGKKAEGMAFFGAFSCRVYISPTWSPEALLAAHEFAHCFDHYVLGDSHNGFTDEGCALGNSYCSPDEGYVVTYLFLFEERCGRENVAALGLEGPGEPCDLPHPTDATPEALTRFLD